MCSYSSVLVRGTRKERYRIVGGSRGVDFDAYQLQVRVRSCSSVLVRGTREERHNHWGLTRRKFWMHINCECECECECECCECECVVVLWCSCGSLVEKRDTELLESHEASILSSCQLRVCSGVVLRCSCKALAKRDTESLGAHEASILNRYQLWVRSCSSVLVRGTHEEKHRIARDSRGVNFEIIWIASVWVLFGVRIFWKKVRFWFLCHEKKCCSLLSRAFTSESQNVTKPQKHQKWALNRKWTYEDWVKKWKSICISNKQLKGNLWVKFRSLKIIFWLKTLWFLKDP